MTRGRENPACSITETGKRANSVRMLHSHHSPGTQLANPEAPAVGCKRPAKQKPRTGSGAKSGHVLKACRSFGWQAHQHHSTVGCAARGHRKSPATREGAQGLSFAAANCKMGATLLHFMSRTRSWPNC